MNLNTVHLYKIVNQKHHFSFPTFLVYCVSWGKCYASEVCICVYVDNRYANISIHIKVYKYIYICHFYVSTNGHILNIPF